MTASQHQCRCVGACGRHKGRCSQYFYRGEKQATMFDHVDASPAVYQGKLMCKSCYAAQPFKTKKLPASEDVTRFLKGME